MNYLTKISTKSKVIAVGTLILFLLLANQVFVLQKASAAYQGGRLVDNGVFLDASSMNAAQIQSFLQSKGGGLANMSFVINCDVAGQQAKQAYLSIGTPCDQNIPASQIIYYVAQVYGINPKVILSTMQKEQSLITATNPTGWQLTQAMGYGCPTSGSCSDSSNFFWQVDNGTWVMRFHYERANGNNNWWYTSSSWTCGTPKSYYRPNLYPNQNVDFYDQNGIYYQKVFISNAATSSLYCYTPHTYNNPQGLYGLPAFGDRGMYYTGSYNFVRFFELWFGSSFSDAYSARFDSHSPYPSSTYSGQTNNAFIQYKNLGSARWYDSTSAPAGVSPIHLAATSPINRSSIFGASWPNSGRPNLQFSKVYESNGITLAANQHVVEPGQIARFEFTITIPNDIAPGVYREHFQPVVENSNSWAMGGLAWLEITVINSYSASYVSQNSYPNVTQNSIFNSQIKYRNSGYSYWYDSVSATNGIKPVHLAASGPINRRSIFSQSWPLNNRPNLTFSKVYESDGITLALNQHVVAPGQVAQFDFVITTGADTPVGVYREYFQPVVDGSRYWEMGGVSWIDVTVRQRSGAAQFHSQSTYPTSAPGIQNPAFISYRNGTNFIWYDNTSVPIGLSTVNLATTLNINRPSIFSWGWPLNNRPSLSFSKVYESDGITMSVNQNIVSPGQIAQYNFNITPPWSSGGYYREHFQPIVEGSSNWNIGGLSWLDVNINN